MCLCTACAWDLLWRKPRWITARLGDRTRPQQVITNISVLFNVFNWELFIPCQQAGWVFWFGSFLVGRRGEQWCSVYKKSLTTTSSALQKHSLLLVPQSQSCRSCVFCKSEKKPQTLHVKTTSALLGEDSMGQSASQKRSRFWGFLDKREKDAGYWQGLREVQGNAVGWISSYQPHTSASLWSWKIIRGTLMKTVTTKTTTPYKLCTVQVVHRATVPWWENINAFYIGNHL